MEEEDLIQSVFLGFIIAFFFKAFDFIFNYPLSLIRDEFRYSILSFFYQLILLLSLGTISLFLLGNRPYLLRLKNKELIIRIKKIRWWCLGILIVTILLFWIICSIGDVVFLQILN